jgi:iron complex outermembrane receptor protein
MKTTPLPIALAIMALPFAAHAEDRLPTVVVTGSPLKEAPAASVVGAEDIARMRAATSDTASLLADIPGVSLYGAGGVSSLPAVHGMADDRLRIKVDGMDLAAACPNHMNPPLSYLDPSSVGTLKVYAGISPVSVGGDSIGGSIVADTAAPKFADQGGPSVSTGELGGFYRSNNNARGANASATWANDSLNLSYGAAYAQADNYTAADNFKTTTATGRPGHTLPLDEVGSTAYETRNQTLGVAYKHANHLLDAKFGYQDIPQELYPNQRMDMLGNTEKRYNLRYLGTFDWGGMEARAYHETVRHHMDFGADKQYFYGSAPLIAPGMPMDTDSKTSGATLKANLNLAERDVLRVGTEYLRYRLNDWWPPSPDCGTCVGGMAPLTFWNINDGRRDRLATFGEWEANWSQQWLSLIGMRFERVTTDTGPVQGYNTAATYASGYLIPATNFNAQDRKRTDNNWDIAALGRYSPSATSSYEFGLARKTRSPNLYERYSWSPNSMALEMNNFVGDGNGYLGDPNLKPEVAYTLSTTADWRGADGTAGVTVTPYVSRVSDYIDAVRRPDALNMMGVSDYNTTVNNKFVKLQYANQAARIYGIDVSGRLPLAKTELGNFGFKGLLNYTKGKNLDTGDGLYNIMPLNGKLTLAHDYGAWSNSMEIVGVRAKDDVSAVRNEIKTPGYELVHLRASYTWKQVRLDFGIENLLDKFYYLPTGGAYTGQGMTMSFTGIAWGIAVPGAGRSLYAGLNVKL